MNNSTLNYTLPSGFCAVTIESGQEKVLKTLAYCCMLLLSITGNCLVITVVYKNHSMQTTVNYLIVNMAVSDLLQSLIAIPKNIVEIYYGPTQWLISGKAGEFFCKCVPFFTDISTAVSILSLVIIAFDRFLGVVFPMRASIISKRMHSVNMAFTWIIAMSFHAPYFFAFHIKFQGTLHCIYSWDPLPFESARIYFLVTSISLYFFPLTLLVILYSTILVKLTRRKTPGNSSFRTQQRISKRNRSVVRMVLAVVVVFALCWLPINTYVYMAYFFWTPQELSCFGKLLFWGKFVAYSNTALTPFLYFLFSQNYRQGLKYLFCGQVATLKTSIHTRPRNYYEGGREASLSDSKSKTWAKYGMSLKSPQSTSLSDNQYNCIPRFAFR